MLFKILIALAVIWLVLSFIGFLVHLAFWVIVIGLVLFAASAIFGWVQRNSGSSSSSRS